ncbi:hypothetical protein PTTG_27943 [Puccinia triticina 1-1 BBBD Race 1]|uniref:Uncharacterized protein n=1 Tax=Puccinia triticina (isolate 1-1 / race 1 (BBBD)) TaxID=630390 RepID=A0A180GG02_PUCT1|nr:hypothetical protein PTTG_27943 [Puccinia triticina 1-1 BBBD Race 1]WAR54284.1 hypothetical protein PtB15_3B798 [Puccinia triticina]
MAEAPATPINPASKPKKTTKKKAVPWDRDGVDGGNSSMDIVLEWLSSDSNYQQWRGDLEEGKTKKSLCSEILQIMIVSGITHRITQKISDLQSSYNTARDWKRNTGAGILESDAVNGVKTVEDQVHFLCRYWDILDPVMGLRLIAEPLYTRSSVPNPEGQMDNPTGDSIGNKNSNLLSSVQTQKKTKKRRKSVGRSSTKNRKGQKKANPEEFYMKSVIVKRQAEMTKARAEASKAKVSYMKELRELGLEYSEIKKAVDEEFPAIPDILADSQEDESDSDEDSS